MGYSGCMASRRSTDGKKGQIDPGNPGDALMTRETLLHRVRMRQNGPEWEEFVYYYRGYLYSIASHMGLNHHDAEDVVQDVMVQLWKKLPEFEYDSTRGRFRGWLYTVVANRVKTKFRDNSRNARHVSIGENEQPIDSFQDTKTLPMEKQAKEEWITYIVTIAWQRVQESLGEKERAAFEMTSKGTAVDEVAQKLGITASSVYVYKKRVSDRLKEEAAQLVKKLD